MKGAKGPSRGARFAGSVVIGRGRSVAEGRAAGEALVSRQAISFYGGVDARTGRVIERGHELEGQSVKDRILVFPRGRGSTVGSYVIYGLAANRVAPLALVNEQTETIVATGAILAGIPCVDGIDLTGIRSGDILEVDADRGTVKRFCPKAAPSSRPSTSSRGRETNRRRQERTT